MPVSDIDIEKVRSAVQHRTQIKCRTVARMMGIPHTDRMTNSKIGVCLRLLGWVPWTQKQGNTSYIRKWQMDLIMKED